jgi:hypothetical protein
MRKRVLGFMVSARYGRRAKNRREATPFAFAGTPYCAVRSIQRLCPSKSCGTCLRNRSIDMYASMLSSERDT